MNTDGSGLGQEGLANETTEPSTAALGGEPLGAGYVMFERLGSGAMGEVRRGATVSGEPVAVKVLRPELSEDPGIVARFLQERSILVGVHHPNVVSVRDLVAEGGRLAIVMDLVQGRDLRAELDERRNFAPADAATLVAELLRGLAAVHAAGVVHRDLKPENILLDKSVAPEPAIPRITDFGIAKFVSGSRSSRRTSVIGTPDYMAPELIDDAEPTISSDLYGVGVILYELVSGVTPFSGGSPLAILRRHVETPPARPSDYPDDLWAITDNLLAKDPAARPSSAALVAASLEATAPGLAGVKAIPYLVTAPMGEAESATVLSSVVPTSPTPAATSLPADSPRRRGPMIAAVVAVLALLLVGAGGVYAATRNSQASAAPETVPSSTSPTQSATPPLSSDTPTPTDSATPSGTPSTPDPSGLMPDVVGESITTAAATLSAANIAWSEQAQLDTSKPDGTILAQSTPPGGVVSGPVTLTVARRAAVTWLADIGAVSGSPSTDPVRINGKAYVHGLSTNSLYCGGNADWEYDLGKGFLTLSGLAGLTDNSDAAASANVEIYRDGTRVWSKIVRLGRPASFTVDVSGTLRLKILITQVTCGNQDSTVALGDPALRGLPTSASPSP